MENYNSGADINPTTSLRIAQSWSRSYKFLSLKLTSASAFPTAGTENRLRNSSVPQPSFLSLFTHRQGCPTFLVPRPQIHFQKHKKKEVVWLGAELLQKALIPYFGAEPRHGANHPERSRSQGSKIPKIQNRAVFGATKRSSSPRLNKIPFSTLIYFFLGGGEGVSVNPGNVKPKFFSRQNFPLLLPAGTKTWNFVVHKNSISARCKGLKWNVCMTETRSRVLS